MSPTFVEYDAAHLEPLLRMWRESFEFGVGITDPHPLSEQREYFVSRVLPDNEVTLALVSSQLVGFVAASEESVSQLHVRVGFHRRGIGSALLALAKARSSGTLWLYTFARNVNACRFYEEQGFVVVERGFEPHWKLEDVKYAWSAPTHGRT
ncbi:MAG: N-acetyltransferase family protein [Caldimonas sp.]